jgi:subtilisin family serine protease
MRLQMRWFISLCFAAHIFCSLLCFPKCLRAQNQPNLAIKPPNRASWAGQPKYKPDEILVRFRPGVSAGRVNSLHAALRAQQLKSWTSVAGLQLVRLPAGTRLKDALHAYGRSPDVLYAEPNYIVHAFTTPNDPLFPQQWSLQNTGQMGGMVGADIHATQAWSVATGSSNLVVAVIDTGMDYTHPDLAANAWASSAAYSVTVNGTTITCPPGSHGFNAVNDTCDPMDDNGHGTHVSGTIGAVGNNGVGVVGVNWSVRILPCKFLDSSGGGTTDAAVTCLDLIQNLKASGTNIIATNNSWGGGGFSQALEDAIQAQQTSGILFIAAAGNDSSDNDLVASYPSDYFLPNIISVAATTRFDWLADFSDFGLHSVSLGAPGQEILSTFPNNSYLWLSGTSMATPHVTGVAALLAAQDPSRDWRAIRNLLLAGGDTIPSLAQTISGKRLDAYGSMTCSNSNVARMVQPTLETITGTSGTPILLAAININCAQPAGPVTVTVSPGSQTITLLDDGIAPDQAAQDGIYSGQWTPPGFGNYLLTFSTGDTVQVTVLNNYVGGESSYNYQSITGTNLNLGDDDVATLNLPFSLQFGGGGFSTVYVSSNGTLSFTNAFDDFLNFSIPVNYFENLNSQNSPPPALLQPVVTLVAPYWMDLYPVKGTNQNVFWEVIGSAPNRQLVVEWRNVRSFACLNDSNASVTFQVIFSESTSAVVFNYANTVFGDSCADQNDGAVASIGMQVSQNVGVQWGGPSVSEYTPGITGIEQPTVASGMAVQWTLVNPNAPPNPAPAASSVSPSSLPVGSPDTWVTIAGTGFVPDSQAYVYPGWSMVTKYVNSTQVQVLLTASDLTYAGGIQINVTNPAPGGGTTQAVYVTVVGQNPVITSISPSSIPAGSFGFILTVNGSGFVPGTDVVFNGVVTGADATFVNQNQVTFGVTGAMVQTAGTVNVQVQTSATTFSNTVPFTITAANAPATLQAPVPGGSQSNGTSVHPKTPIPGRFLGWKAAQALGLGPQYAARYKRPLSRLALSIPDQSRGIGTGSHQAPTPFSSGGTVPAPASFNFRPTLPAGFIPTAVVSGDFNGDGKLDWAVANGGDNTIWIYLGNGDGTAQLPTIVRLMGDAPVALATADMNGDGKLDLVVAEADSLAVAVLLGNGDGTFGPELTFTVPGSPESLAVADFNGDGKLDVVVGLAVAEAEIAFLPGDGTGRLGQPVLHYGQGDGLCTTFAIAVADLNGDGLPDVVALDFSISPMNGVLITSQMGDSGARVYLNGGDGTFKLTQQLFHDTSSDQGPQDGQAVTAVALADVDGDGCVDAVTLDSLGTATFFPGLCDGTFDTANTRISGTGIIAATAALADVNGDGKLDLISSAIPFLNDALYPSTPASSLSVQFGDGTGNFGGPTLYRGESSMVSLTAADLKMNSRPEIITVNQDSDTVSVYQNDGSGGFGAPKGGYVGYLANGQMHAVGNAPISNFAVTDLNGDGLPDLATLETGAQFPLPTQVAVALNDGSGGFRPTVRTPLLDVYTEIPDFYFADFRNSGHKDLLFFSLTLNVYGFAPTYWYAKSNGDGTFQRPVGTSLPSPGLWPVQFAYGDFNNDGKLDFVIVSYASAPTGSGTVAALFPYLGNGDGTFTQGTPLSFPSSVTQSPYLMAATVADVNGDGKPDILVLGSQLLSGGEQNAIYEFLGNGDGTFQAPKLVISSAGPFAVVDLNKDGHPDIVAALDEGTNPEIFGRLWAYQVFMGNADGSFTPGQTYGPYPNPYGAGYLYPAADHPLGPPHPVVSDFNGDGFPDLAIYTTAGTNVFGEIGYAGAPLSTQVFILTGNGDGTFSVPNNGYGLGGLVVPQTATDLNGDGRTDLLEMNAYTSAYTYLTATNGATFTVGLVSDPVIGATGKLRIILTSASPNGTTLQLSASDPNIAIPASITIPAGANSQDVTFQLGTGFNSSHVFALTAQLGTETHIAYGTQAPNAQSAGFVAALQSTVTPVIAAGQTTPDYGLLIASVGGYSTQITITCPGLPTAASCQIVPNPANLPAGGEIAVAVMVATQPTVQVGQYSFTVNLTDGVVSTSLPAAFNVGDFSMSLTPTAQTLGSTDYTSFTLNIQSINGYSQPIQITCSGFPTGTACPFSSPVSPGANYFQVQTQNAANGVYNFTLTGTSGGLMRTASGQLTVTSGTFTGSVSPSSATIAVGSSKNFTVQVNSTSGFQGQVNLSCYAASGLTCQLTPPQVSVSTGGSASATLSIGVTTAPGFVPGDFRRIFRGQRGRPPLIYLLLVFTFTIALWIRASWRGQDSSGARRPAYIYATALTVLLLLALGIASCGGGGGSTGGGGGNGGGGGGGGSVTNVNVEGSAGGTTVTLGSVTVTIP